MIDSGGTVQGHFETEDLFGDRHATIEGTSGSFKTSGLFDCDFSSLHDKPQFRPDSPTPSHQPTTTPNHGNCSTDSYAGYSPRPTTNKTPQSNIMTVVVVLGISLIAIGVITNTVDNALSKPQASETEASQTEAGAPVVPPDYPRPTSQPPAGALSRSPPPIGTVYGTAFPSETRVFVGQPFTWTANAAGGNGHFSYQWSGDHGIQGRNSIMKVSYNTPGKKMAIVSITSGSVTIRRSAVVDVIPRNAR